MRRLRQLVAQAWHTDEIRKYRPSPVDEAKWGFAVVENSLWEGVPNFLRELNEQVEAVVRLQAAGGFCADQASLRGWAAIVTATRTSPPISPAMCCSSAAGKRPTCSCVISPCWFQNCPCQNVRQKLRELCGDPEALEPYRDDHEKPA